MALARSVKARAVCWLCGFPPTPADPLEVHHRVPVSEGGDHSPGNFAPVHKSCHEQEHARRRRR